MRAFAIAALSLLAVTVSCAAGYGFGRHVVSAAASSPAPDPVDVGFAQAMRAHHDQAIVMTQILLGRGDTPLAGLARAIQSAQLLEIGQMKGWLQLWRQPLLPATPGMDWMLFGREPPDAALKRYLSDCRDAAGGMPGLATQEELERLRRLDGPVRDRLFLGLMIRHHEGGLPMARFAARNAGSDAVRALGAEIVAQQTQELATMALALQHLGGA
ncbi:DUF305 domain-containing protein [Solimonas soli]|uniref:DUF305 domain-containing protein n=1 Tax=Solimonas soli TaxID=413479 RepID=UPI0004BB85A7|nr:DUF305 domain-containing protein [Solimonas soli]